MKWVAFTGKAEFLAWHDARCAAQNIPRPGVRSSDGEPMIQAQWTDAWVDPVIDVNGRVIAFVPDADADGLPVVDVTIDKDAGTVEATGPDLPAVPVPGKGKPSRLAFVSDEWRLAKPSTVEVAGRAYSVETGVSLGL